MAAGPDGRVFGKEDDLEGYRSGALRVTSLVEESIDVRDDGLAGITRIVAAVAAVQDGVEVSARLRYTRLWVREADRWRVLAATFVPCRSAVEVRRRRVLGRGVGQHGGHGRARIGRRAAVAVVLAAVGLVIGVPRRPVAVQAPAFGGAARAIDPRPGGTDSGLMVSDDGAARICSRRPPARLPHRQSERRSRPEEHRMPITLENVGIAVRDIDAAIDFFTDLGLIVLGRDTVSGEWADTAVGLDGNHAKIAMLRTPDGNGRLELFEYIHPDAIDTEPTLPNEIGMHRVAFSVDDIDDALEIAARHGCHPLRGVATYGDVYKLTYLRGPSGILVMLAEALKKS